MQHSFLSITNSGPLQGALSVSGSKNASMVILLSSLLAKGICRFHNIPTISDVFQIGNILTYLGATFLFDTTQNTVEIDTSHVCNKSLPADLMKTTRASILVLGPLLARFGQATLGFPGGDAIGRRPIDLHLFNLAKMGMHVVSDVDCLTASVEKLVGAYLVLAYPSVGATENILMAAVLAKGRTTIVNAAIEPEVLDLIAVLRLMGALISIHFPATIIIDGVSTLHPVSEYTIIPDRLEAGALLIAAGLTGGDVYIANISHTLLDVLLLKLIEMGHEVSYKPYSDGIWIKGSKNPCAVSFKTGPYPNFPTDLQAPMMAGLICAQGISLIEETVFENRLQHANPLAQLGAHIEIMHSNKAKIVGVPTLHAADVIGNDIRAVCSLVLAGLIAQGHTRVFGVSHWLRGFEGLEKKLSSLGAQVSIVDR
jgi:UDP-N-acetylglucosamine 1-carboxyvinyltransferase